MFSDPKKQINNSTECKHTSHQWRKMMSDMTLLKAYGKSFTKNAVIFYLLYKIKNTSN